MSTLPELVVTPRISYTNYTGDETIAPTENEYFLSKIDEARDKALYRMSQTEYPEIPEIPFTEGEGRWGLKSKIAKGIALIPDKHLTISILGRNMDPNVVRTCLATALKNYGQRHYVSGIKTFLRNPSHYGFIQTTKPIEGDLILQDDTHSGIIRTVKDNKPVTIMESKGGWTPDQINLNSPYSDWIADPNINITYYTFVGNRQDHTDWSAEWNRKFGNKK